MPITTQEASGATPGERQAPREKQERHPGNRADDDRKWKDIPRSPRNVPKRPGADPTNKPARDSREDPAPNPAAGGGLPQTSTRAEVTKVRPDLRR